MKAAEERARLNNVVPQETHRALTYWLPQKQWLAELAPRDRVERRLAEQLETGKLAARDSGACGHHAGHKDVFEGKGRQTRGQRRFVEHVDERAGHEPRTARVIRVFVFGEIPTAQEELGARVPVHARPAPQQAVDGVVVRVTWHKLGESAQIDDRVVVQFVEEARARTRGGEVARDRHRLQSQIQIRIQKFKSKNVAERAPLLQHVRLHALITWRAHSEEHAHALWRIGGPRASDHVAAAEGVDARDDDDEHVEVTWTEDGDFCARDGRQLRTGNEFRVFSELTSVFERNFLQNFKSFWNCFDF